ncbi:MAG: hypothetical protein J6N76_04610, partial [Lachnospiraceae bacterium]|nr:hypothetical protein [Lachnospiraceae bacterium]
RIDLFNSDHPKIGRFLGTIRDNAVTPGTVIEVKVTTPAGTVYESNMKLTDNDVETIRMLSESGLG